MAKKRILKHLGNVGMAIISASLMTSSALAIDFAQAAGQVIGAEGGKKVAKETLDATLKMAKSKPAMSAATGIGCLSYILAAGTAASPGLCIACGILIAKTFGQFMAKISLNSEGLLVDWISFNLEDLVNPRIIAGRLQITIESQNYFEIWFKKLSRFKS